MWRIRFICLAVIVLLGSGKVLAQRSFLGSEILYSPNGEFVAHSNAGTLRVWNPDSGSLVFEDQFEGDIHDITWSANSINLAAAIGGGYVLIWNVADPNQPAGTLLTEFQPYQGTRNLLTAIEWSPDGQTIAIAGAYGQQPIRFLDANTYMEADETAGSIEVGEMAWNPVLPILATTNYAAGRLPIAMPAINSNQIATTICGNSCTTENAHRLDWNSTGNKLAIGNENGTVYIIDMDTDQPIVTIELNEYLTSLAWSFDDKFLVTHGSDIRIWDSETGVLAEALDVSTFAVDFHPSRYELAYFDNTTQTLVIEDVSGLVPSGQGDRVTQDLVALYTFEDGSGSTVADVSGVGSPLDLTIQDPNNVTWGNQYLTIETDTLISSGVAATKIIDGVVASNELSIEAWIAADNLTQEGPARIISIGLNHNNRNVMLGQGTGSQQPTAYEGRLRTTQPAKVGKDYSEINSPENTITTNLQHVIYTRDAAGTVTLYVNGVVVATDTALGDMSNWDTTWQLGLGNELSSNRPWLGTFYLAAIYDRALTAAEVNQNLTAGPGNTQNQPPVAQAGMDQTRTDVDGDGSETISLDGSGSVDNDGVIVGYDWSEGGSTIATGVTPTLNLGIGIHNITLTVTDNQGEVGTDELSG